MLIKLTDTSGDVELLKVSGIYRVESYNNGSRIHLIDDNDMFTYKETPEDIYNLIEGKTDNDGTGDIYEAPVDLDNDGWIEWKGGECPVDRMVMVYVSFRTNKLHNEMGEAGSFSWIKSDEDIAIVKYRIVK